MVNLGWRIMPLYTEELLAEARRDMDLAGRRARRRCSGQHSRNGSGAVDGDVADAQWKVVANMMALVQIPDENWTGGLRREKKGSFKGEKEMVLEQFPEYIEPWMDVALSNSGTF